MKLSCSACGSTVELVDRIGFRDTCSNCDAFLHSCVNCRFWTKDQCTEPSAEKVRDPEGQNYCDWFEVRRESGVRSQETGSRDAAEEMWKKFTGKK